MNWINLLGLLLGAALGAGGSWLLRLKPSASKADNPSKNSDSQLFNLHQQLHQTQLAYRRVAEMAQFKGGFLARTAHELRSPISQLICLHQMILSDLCDNPAEEREFVEQANLAALKLLERLDHLINISKLEVGRVQPQIQPLDLASIFDQVRQLTQMQAANRGLFLEVLPPDREVHVLADRKWLQQALVTLVQTAIDLTETGSIRLLVLPQSAASDLIYIWLEDYRPAKAWHEPLDLLSPQNAMRQFPPNSPQNSPFLAPDHPSITHSLSSGLSLEGVQNILQAMQGRLDILSTPITPASTPYPADTPDPNLTRIQCSIPSARDPGLER